MNTLSKMYTKKVFGDEKGYEEFRKKWVAAVNSGRKLNAAHHLAYLALMGKNWHKGFALPTNKNKVANGYKPVIVWATELARWGRWASEFEEEFELPPHALSMAMNYVNGFRVVDGKYDREPYKLPEGVME